ncbi:MAG: LysR family transcriptional regulator [Bryobacterales bacterium]|nr:LysR family transcriptional regulator [Bryobacterales bacterium]
MRQDLNDLYYFVQVVDHQGFAQAGRALGLPKSKLSRRISALEQRLGVRLIQRSTRRFSVTELGNAYYARCKAMLVEAEAAQTIIESVHSAPCGTLRIACPIALLHSLAGPIFVSFAERFPAVTLDIVERNRPVDLLADSLDLALRLQPAPLPDSGVAVRTVGHAAQCLVASPALVRRLGAPSAPDALTAWPSLGQGPHPETHVWNLQGPAGAVVRLSHSPRFITTDMITLRLAAVAGIGAVQLPVMLVRDQLADGSLVRLLPGWAPAPEAIHIAFPSRRGLIPSVRALIDHLAEHCKGFDTI